MMQLQFEDVHVGHGNLDKVMLEAVEAGIESGISIGVLEAYNYLVMQGYSAAAESLMHLVNEDTEARKIKGDA